MPSYDTARDEMFGLITNVWPNAQALLGLNYVPELRFQGVEGSSKPDPAKYFARLSTQMVREGQGALAGKVFDSAGLFFIQCFGPMNDSQVWAKLSQLSELALNAIRGNKTPSGVWFRNVKRQDNSGNDGKFWFQNVVAEFQFTENVFVV